MDNKHTPEPWVASIEPNKKEWGIDAGKWGIAICADAPGDGTAEGNARRIVACVNACAGIPTELLEDARCWAEAGIETATSLRKQRDELLAALEKCRKELSAWMRDHGDDIATQEAVADARAAIAKATGQ